MQQWSSTTAAIIAAHNKDFNSSNYSTKMDSSHYGGFGNYVTKTLGGVFKEHYEKLSGGSWKAKTLDDYYETIEYVMGLMAIWGFDYYNGKTYWHWGSTTSKPAADAFYQTGKGKCNGGTITQLCCGSSGKSRTTNCNYGVDTLLRNLGLYKKGSDAFTTWATTYGKLVTSKANLQPGDMVHFFSKSITRNKVSTWKGKGWKHIAIVYKVDKANKKVWLADFGSRFIKTKKPLHYMTIDTSAKGGGEYNSYYWGAIHAFNFAAAGQGTDQSSSTSPTPAPAPTPTEEVIPVPKTIKSGSTGKAVKVWQAFLGGLTVDGKFGAKTKAATIKFQKSKGLTQDGIVGDKTWTAALKSLQ